MDERIKKDRAMCDQQIAVANSHDDKERALAFALSIERIEANSLSRLLEIAQTTVRLLEKRVEDLESLIRTQKRMLDLREVPTAVDRPVTH